MKHLNSLYSCLLAGFMALLAVACVDDAPIAENRYANKSEMVSSYLENRSEDFSEFINVLHRAKLWDLMGTYGEYTCLAPTNDAIHTFLSERGLSSLDELPDADCDTLAWSHIIKQACYITDLATDFGSVTMNGCNLYLSCDSTATGGNLAYYVNEKSRLIHYDDSVQNGVVHVLDRVIVNTSEMLPYLMKKDTAISIFVAALVETHLADSLTKYEDETYTIGLDSVKVTSSSKHHRTFGNNNVYWDYPEHHRYYFTVFTETDDVFKRRGINSIDDLRRYAKAIYDDTYPEDAGKYDNDPTHRKNPLNRFVAYHIMDRFATYDELTLPTTSGDFKQFKTELQDVMEFYETLCPFTILQVCDAANDKWVNRRGLGNKYKVRGCKITQSYKEATNGLYHYIDDILTYNRDETIDQVLNVRMRIDASTLSPDFMMKEDRARNCKPQNTGIDFYMMGFKPGYAKNFIFSDDTFFGVHKRFWCNSWENDMCACLDNFDIKFRIPPVPAGQTYEVRLGYVCGTNRTVVQVYFDDNLTGDIPCDIPIDLRLYAGSYGWKADSECADEEEIEAVDKSMRNNGFMKGYSAFVPGYGGNTGDTPRDWIQCMRRILTTRYLEPEHNYYIRLRQVLENNAEMSLDYIEIVPKSVYDGAIAEDRY